MGQRTEQVANGRVWRITNDTQHAADCQDCDWKRTGYHAASKAKRHALATGHKVRSVVSRISFYDRRNVPVDATTGDLVHVHRTGFPCEACEVESPADQHCWNCGLMSCDGCGGTEGQA